MPTRSAAERRAEARRDYDAFMAECPSRKVLIRISDKWVTLVLSTLADGPRRYNELSRTIAGVSQKMLTQTLRVLERDGLVFREITVGVPVRVDYTLTPLGASLLPLLAAVKSWAEEHIEDVEAARAAYDERNADSTPASPARIPASLTRPSAPTASRGTGSRTRAASTGTAPT